MGKWDGPGYWCQFGCFGSHGCNIPSTLLIIYLVDRLVGAQLRKSLVSLFLWCVSGFASICGRGQRSQQFYEFLLLHDIDE